MLLREDQLTNVYRAFILGLGGSAAEAETFADMFVIADLRGTDWQGIKTLRRHVLFPIQQGIVKLGQRIEVVNESPSSIVLDAKSELGQVTCKQTMESAIAKARESGTCVAVARNSGDTGLLASYTMMALQQDCIGVMYSNTAPFIAPWGGTDKMHGVGPLSIAIPAGEAYPVVVDMALTEIKEAFDQKAMQAPPFPLPPPMSFETVREYALSVMLELMCGALAGMPIGRNEATRWQCGVFCMAIHIPHFMEISQFHQRVDAYIREVKATKPAQGSLEVLLPGERGFREQEKRVKEGVPVEEDVWANVTAVADQVGVDLKDALGT